MQIQLGLELLRVVEQAAIASARTMGTGDRHKADQAATETMRRVMDHVPMDGTVVIGEGERDEAPMLFIGEKVGTGKGPKVDIALDPLEGTTLTAKAMADALAVVAIAEGGSLLHAPDTYMDKIAIGGGYPEDIVDLDADPRDNIKALAKAKGVPTREITACILDRPRHAQLIERVREAGAAVKLISDGDIAGVMHTADPDTGIDIYIGQGGAPEGVLAAAALRCIGGQMQGRLMFENDEQVERVRSMGHPDPLRKFSLEEMARGDVMFAATGVTSGAMLRGVKRLGHGAITHSIVMRSKSGTVRYIEGHHNFTKKTWTPT